MDGVKYYYFWWKLSLRVPINRKWIWQDDRLAGVREPLCTVGGAVLLYLEYPTSICEIQVTGLPFGHEITAARTDFLPLKYFPYLQKEEEKRFPNVSAPSNQSNTELAFVHSYYLILYDTYGNHKETVTHCQNESKTLTLQTGSLVFACKKCCSPKDSRSHASRIQST